MATLNLTKDEFADIAIIYIFDQTMNPDQVSNKNFKEFLDKHSSKIRTPLMKYYMDSSGEPRIRYRRIKGIFDGSSNSIQQIRIGPSDKIKGIDKKQSVIKKVIKKVLKKEEINKEEINLLTEFVKTEKVN